MAYIEDFISKLNLIPPEADRLLRAIRARDHSVERFRSQIELNRTQLLSKAHTYAIKRSPKLYDEITGIYRKVVAWQSQMDTLTKEKIGLAQQLYNVIHEPTERLQRELQQREGGDDGRRRKGKRACKKGKRSEWGSQEHEPKYCYCGKYSFGEMVMCENKSCEKQWFHRECIGQKRLPERWFCRDCLKQDE